MNYTPKQIDKIKSIWMHCDVIKARKPITLYKASDESLALFRVQAGNILFDYTCREVTGKKQTKRNERFINNWVNDPSELGESVRNFIKTIQTKKGCGYVS